MSDTVFETMLFGARHFLQPGAGLKPLIDWKSCGDRWHFVGFWAVVPGR
jgi:hypothetical protein